ncbi:minor capsid protein [Escherichia phage BrunoManser]|uniref:Minor capsid protein n=1 Tax=Escherichia phage BrunoManser TaxID=2851976 RepID=A0AAE7VPM7_9CAUD|nr:minor capsid protein [Escherichia phage BrunoManser]
MKINGIAKTWRFPESSERQLSRSMEQFTGAIVARMQESLKPMKWDADESQIEQVERSLLDYAEDLLQSMFAALPALAFTIYKFNAKQWIKIAKSAGGSKNQAVMLLVLIGANIGESWYAPQYDLWEAQTKTSLRKFAANMITDFTGKLRDAAANGYEAERVYEETNQRYKVYSSWARNRASGIVTTWNSRMMRQRLKDAQVTHYFWRGMMDLREREKHVKWEGKRIPVNSNHIFPGEEYGCRCWVVPDFNQIGD